jgi:N-acetylglucosaminyldiphosphoundecaprenol N-acetyl-beta-D-mannosaminyltransferase
METGCEDILGYQVTTAGKDECLDLIMSWLKAGLRRKYFVCANPHSLEIALDDDVFDQALKGADLAVPDGVGIVIASRILRGSIRDRVTGSDIFRGLNSRMQKEGGFSVFFLGASEDTLKDIREKMAVDYPSIKVSGTFSPPFKPEFSDNENAVMVAAVNAAAPDVLWVGMTAPKQEKWILRNLDRLNVGFIAPVGAVFDFYTGRIKRSHPFFQALGLEWLPRLLREPGRLWRRNFVSNPHFLARVLRAGRGKRPARG